jgi:N-acetylneuraminate synthase
MTSFRVGQRVVGNDAPTYFIADISANHDGQLARAVDLIHLAAESGASASMFQNLRAAHMFSDKGFRDLGDQVSHQAKWKRSVTEVYQDASLPWEWTPTLKAECDRAGIDYFSTPYDLEAVEMLAPYVEIFKIGSGDITWLEMVRAVARTGKPVLLATGASDMQDVERAIAAIRDAGVPYGVMQCNTNYTGSLENFRHIHLNVLRTFGAAFPDAVLGLSDHTPGHATVLGAVTLGARVVEKHFTDDTSRDGPDHPFSMTPASWRDMVDRTRELELALGDSTKEVADNERQTVVVQRRSLRATRDLAVGESLTRDDLEPLRPSPAGSVPPYAIDEVVGRRLARPIARGEALSWDAMEEL